MKTYQDPEAFRQATGRISRGITETINMCRKTDVLGSYPPELKEVIWSSYCVSPLPGCCGVIVSHNASVHRDMTGKGLGKYFHAERLEFMRDLGYSCGLATTVSYNETEIRILEANGWQAVHKFTNRRTRRQVTIWVKDL
jgi:hypothetical protein